MPIDLSHIIFLREPRLLLHDKVHQEAAGRAEHEESLLGNTHKQHAHTLGCGLGHKDELDEPR